MSITGGRRGDEGLTTLEWLLVVAAVAGLAAVAVVLVQRVVGGTAEQIESHSARQTAAELAARELQNRWRAEDPDASTVDSINGVYAARCRRIGIIYADIDLKAESKGGAVVSGGTGWDPAALPVCPLA